MEAFLVCLAIALPLTATTAFSAEGQRPWDLELGMGMAQAPDYEGATTASPRMKIWADGAYRTDGFGVIALDSGSLTVSPELRWDIIDSTDFGVGPLVGYRTGRNDSNPKIASANDGSARLHGLPNVAAAVDLGISVHRTVGGVPLFAQVRSAVSDAQGTLAVVGAYAPLEPTADLELTVLPTITWADARQTRAFFGVTPSAAQASGFPPYSPGAGWQNGAIEVGADWQFASRWHLIASLAYQRLLGEAARSPIVQSPNQMSVLVGISCSL